MNTSPIVSVVIPAYVPSDSRRDAVLRQLRRCTARLLATIDPSASFEILVQDDCSPGVDNLTGLLPSLVKIERNRRNLGFSGNCNAAARRSSGEFVFFLNQDTIPMSQWHQFLLSVFMDERTLGQCIGLCGPKLLYLPTETAADDSPLFVESCGGWFDAALQPIHRYRGCLDDSPAANVREEVSWITGAAHFWRREAFEQIGGYDEEFVGGYFEDVDACCRLRRLGWRVWYCPEARFVHQGGTSKMVTREQFLSNAELFRQRWVVTQKLNPETDIIWKSWWTWANGAT